MDDIAQALLPLLAGGAQTGAQAFATNAGTDAAGALSRVLAKLLSRGKVRPGEQDLQTIVAALHDALADGSLSQGDLTHAEIHAKNFLNGTTFNDTVTFN